MAFIEIQPPVGGMHRRFSHADSMKYPTSEYMDNVRAIDTQEKRLRIGQRPAVVKWGNGDQIGGDEQPVVFMCSVSSVV